MSDTGLASDAVALDLPNPSEAGNVEYAPSEDRLRGLSTHLETTTEYGSPSYVSDYRSRSADRTRNSVDDGFTEEDLEVVETAVDAARTDPVVCLDLQMGAHPDHTYVCRFYVSSEHARIALALSRLLPRTDSGEPDFVTVQVPDRDEVAIRVLPEQGFTAVVGSDYTGEAKKSFLRMFMYDVKRAGGLGLHAGSKRLRLRDESGDGGLREVGQLFLGLSATGKSTLTSHGLGLEEPECAEMLQDDVCGLLTDGTVVGSEPNGLYLKTIGLDESQSEVYGAVTHPTSVLENVDVADDGTVEFDSDRHTSNGRAAVLREHLTSACDGGIDLESLDQVFFITRNSAMPPIARLDAEEAACAFVLGESIQTSAGDPSRAGEAIRVVGTNPFIVGSAGEEGNRFRDLIASLDVECFVINTGDVGGRDVGVAETTAVLEAVARGDVEWTDNATGLTVPEHVPGVDVEAYRVSENLDDHEARLRELRDDRRNYLESFENLDHEIVDAVY